MHKPDNDKQISLDDPAAGIQNSYSSTQTRKGLLYVVQNDINYILLTKTKSSMKMNFTKELLLSSGTVITPYTGGQGFKSCRT